MKALTNARLFLIAGALVTTYTGCTKDPVNPEGTEVVDTYKGKPYRAFVTFQRYNLEQMGEDADSIANVRLEITLPGGVSLALPENGQYWPIGDRQTQEINRTYEIPWSTIRNDGFRMKVQMVRRGSEMLPCEIEVSQLSQFNRAYVCHTNVQWQIKNNKVTDETADKEGIQLRIFTDLNSPSSEIPKEIAHRR